jgi:hypothetical protein
MSIITCYYLHLTVAQQLDKKTAIPYSQNITIEGGLNLSVPVHIQMYRSHRVGIGVNVRVSKKISPNRTWY